MGLWDNLKDKWNQFTGKGPVDHVAEQRRRRKLRESINDPDDLFFDDEVLDGEELARVARKRRNRNSFRRGYYIFGAILGTAMIVIAVYNMISTPKPDLQVLLQEDGVLEQGDIEDIQKYLEQYVEDQNGDGKITVTFTRISMPAQRTEDNESQFEAAYHDMDEQLVPFNIAFFVGREEFISMADCGALPITSPPSRSTPLRRRTYRSVRTARSTTIILPCAPSPMRRLTSTASPRCRCCRR